MKIREWLAIGAVLVALLGIGAAVLFGPRDANDDPDGWREHLDQLTAVPDKGAEDKAVGTIERLGGQFSREDRGPEYRPVARVDLRGCPVTDADMKELTGLRGVTELLLAETRISDAGLKEVARLPVLNTLNLSDTAVTDAGLKELSGLVFLQTLDLSNTAVTGAGLADLNGRCSVTRLSLAGSNATDAGLAGLAGGPAVRELDLSETNITDAGLPRLKPLVGLGTLNLAATKVTGRSVEFLLRLPVRSFDLTGIPLTPDEFVRLQQAMDQSARGAVRPSVGAGQGPGVEETPAGPAAPAIDPTTVGPLKIVGIRSAITDEWLQDVAKSGRLDQLVERFESFNLEQFSDSPTDHRVLDLSGSRVTDAGLRTLRGFDGFDNLSLNDTVVGDAGLTHVRGHSKLRAVQLQKTKVTDLGLKELANLTELRILYLDGTRVTDAGLSELRSLERLRQLHLANTGVTDGGLQQLHRLRALEILDVSGTSVSEAGIAKLKAALPKCSVWH